MASPVFASSSTLGPTTTPRTRSSTTSGTIRRGISPATSGATTMQSTIQNSEVAASSMAVLPVPASQLIAPRTAYAGLICWSMMASRSSNGKNADFIALMANQRMSAMS